MKLSELLKALPAGMSGEDSTVTAICCDSRKCKAGSVFVCLRGAQTDGHTYAAQAYASGCRVFVCEYAPTLPGSDAEVIITGDTRIALAKLSAAFYGNPARRLKLIGVTGTKGKTTVACFIEQALRASGKKAALIGTLGVFIGSRHYETSNTTPESLELHKYFAEMVEAGIEYAVIEVSSQAYLTSRVYGLEFEIGIFLNLSPDHIGAGEHPDYENYRACKAMLFENSEVAVINISDREADFMRSHARGRVITFAVDGKEADFTARNLKRVRTKNTLGISYECCSGDTTSEVVLNIPGAFNVSNALAATAVCRECGIGFYTTAKTLSSARVPGRFELVDALPNATVVIDYAHNEVSLTSALQTLRRYITGSRGRLICLIGSVGGKAKLRRAALAAAAEKYSDYVILTSDNPDRENPHDIIRDMEKGFSEGFSRYVSVVDRREAIRLAIDIASSNDIVLLAGKGHEKYQIISGQKQEFCERDIVMYASSRLRKG